MCVGSCVGNLPLPLPPRSLARRLNSGSSRAALHQRELWLNGRAAIVKTITKQQRPLAQPLCHSTRCTSYLQPAASGQQPAGVRVCVTCATNTGQLRACENARTRAWQAPPVRPLFCARFRGGRGDERRPWPPIAVGRPPTVVAQRARC